MDSPFRAPRPDSFTLSCRDLVRTFTYEDILSCTIYAAPMVFMIGPASVIANDHVITMVVESLIGFVLGRTLHRMGRRLLTALPKRACRLYVSPSRCLPLRLTVTQFLWVMELIVGAAVLTAVVGKRFLHSADTVGMLSGLSLLVAALILYFTPEYLGRLWIRRYSPAMTLVGPTEEVTKISLPGIRFPFPLT